MWIFIPTETLKIVQERSTWSKWEKKLFLPPFRTKYLNHPFQKELRVANCFILELSGYCNSTAAENVQKWSKDGKIQHFGVSWENFSTWPLAC